MQVDAPFDIELEYVQRMMAGLLFMEAASVAKRARHAVGAGLCGTDEVLLQKTAYEDSDFRGAESAGHLRPASCGSSCRVMILRLHVIEADAGD